MKYHLDTLGSTLLQGLLHQGTPQQDRVLPVKDTHSKANIITLIIMVLWYALAQGFQNNSDVLVTVQPPSSLSSFTRTLIT